MLKTIQKLSFFYISKFEAAAKAMKESGKQPWVEKISKNETSQIWALYKQATEGDHRLEMKTRQQPGLKDQATQQMPGQKMPQGQNMAHMAGQQSKETKSGDQKSEMKKEQPPSLKDQPTLQMQDNKMPQGQNTTHMAGQQSKETKSGQSVPQQEQ